MPAIFRAIQKPYVDRFFDTGELLISSFARCRRLDDAEFRDEGEGSGAIDFTDAAQSKFRVAIGNVNAYVLCATLEKDAAKGFDRGGHIEILDSSRLLRDIAEVLSQSCVHMFEGSCDYLDERAIAREFTGRAILEPNVKEHDDDGNPLFTEEELTEFGNRMSSGIQQQTFRLENTELFLKKPKRFAHQKEYRLVWMMEGHIDDCKTILCPKAIAYCITSK